MSSQAPGKILQLIFLWECRSLYGSLFELALVPDDRCPQPVGPPKKELMAPIYSWGCRPISEWDEGWSTGPRRPKAKGRESYTH